MAIRIPIITDLQDQGLKQAKIAFGNFKSAVRDAEGGLGKFKAGAGSVLDTVGKHAGLFAVAGAAAFAKFAFSGAQAFSTLALESGKFADATGLAVEDASRWKEVSGDIGIGAETLQTGIGKMNKVLGTSPELFKTLGVQVKKTKDGATDVNATFLNVIERLKGIKDPAEKAKVATQLLGKGWQSMAELINMGSAELTANLRSVSEEQIISAEELQKAKDYRDATNDLGDAFTKLKYSAGQSLIPILTTGAQALTVLVDASAQFKREDPLEFANKRIREYFQAARDARDDTDAMKEAIRQARNPMLELASATDKITIALENADTAWRVLTGNFEETAEIDKAESALGKMQAAAEEAFSTGAYDDIVAYNAKAAEFMKILEGIAGNMDNISSKEILFKFRTEGPAAALEYAKYLARGAEYGGLTAEDALGLAGISTGSNNVNGRFRGARASGGPVAGGNSYIVGERGPELFTPGTSGNITPNGGFGGGANITVNVNGGDPNSIVRALQQYVRQSGPVPVNTRAM